jgi:hypothetical protein
MWVWRSVTSSCWFRPCRAGTRVTLPSGWPARPPPILPRGCCGIHPGNVYGCCTCYCWRSGARCGRRCAAGDHQRSHVFDAIAAGVGARTQSITAAVWLWVSALMVRVSVSTLRALLRHVDTRRWLRSREVDAAARAAPGALQSCDSTFIHPLCWRSVCMVAISHLHTASSTSVWRVRPWVLRRAAT